MLDLLEAGFYFLACAVVLDDLLNSEVEVGGKERDPIGRYDVAKEKWYFCYYPLEIPMSAVGGWIGLSEITALDHVFGHRT